ncbi:MAG: tRNA pseudouridine(38-40) synthase TruA [Rickettsiaceae bacterium]|nr:tRNA pseudouridine(38-40) synthase TruA [Rickettsiaceae bacterium]
MTDNKFRYKIIIEYIGKGFYGWQIQENLPTIQGVIEQAILEFTKEKVAVIASGRTDTGVNAYAQVAHFDLSKEYVPYQVTSSLNHFIRPHKIGIIDCEIVSNEFHARFSAKARHYVYKILNRNGINIIDKDLKLWVKDKLDITVMRQASKYLIGKHDFSSFRAKECQAKSAIKTLSEIRVEEEGDNIDIYFSAPSFLHHMVRNIVGSLLLVGRGKWSPEKIKQVLEAKDRKLAGPTAPAYPLYFIGTDYEF